MKLMRKEKLLLPLIITVFFVLFSKLLTKVSDIKQFPTRVVWYLYKPAFEIMVAIYLSSKELL